jgi:hypothetical protein
VSRFEEGYLRPLTELCRVDHLRDVQFDENKEDWFPISAARRHPNLEKQGNARAKLHFSQTSPDLEEGVRAFGILNCMSADS